MKKTIIHYMHSCHLIAGSAPSLSSSKVLPKNISTIFKSRFNKYSTQPLSEKLLFELLPKSKMAQGTIKSKKLTTATAKSSGRRNTVLGPKKGARTIAPRKQVLVRNAGMTKVCLPVTIFTLSFIYFPSSPSFSLRLPPLSFG